MSQIYGKQIVDSSIGLIKWDLAGSQGTFTLGTGSMIGVNDAPTVGTDLTNKQYVDSVAAGLDPKESVTVKSTTNVAAITGLLTLDGHTVSAGDRVLLTNQTNTTENGIYDAAVGTWSRSSDSDGTPSNEVTLGNFTFVGTGSSFGSTGWVLGQTDAPNGDVEIQPGTHSQVWVQFSDAAALSAGAGIALNGSVLSANITDQGGLTFSTSGASGTLQVETGLGIKVTASGKVSADLFATGGLSFNGNKIQIDSSVAGAGSTLTSGVLNVIGGTGVTVNADDIEINFSSFSVLAGNGLTWDGVGNLINVNGGTGITVDAGTDEVVVDGFSLSGAGIVWDAANGEFDVTAGTGITVNADEVVVDGASLAGTGVTWNNTLGQFETDGGDITGVTAGAGLIGGGSTGYVTLDVVGGTGITVNADEVVVDGASLAGTGVTWNASLGQFETDGGDITGVTAGAGLIGGGSSGYVTLDVVGGTGITVNADEVVVDGASLAGTGVTWNNTLGQFETDGGDITGVTAGAGLVGGGSTGYVTLDVVGGTGITVDANGINSNADGTLTANLSALGLTAAVDTIQEALTALMGKSTSLNSEQTVTYTSSSGDNSNTTYALVGTPAADHEINLYVNGQLQRYGSPGTYDYYFSAGGTAGGAKLIDSVANGDILVWNGTQAGFDIVTTQDLITVTYDEVLV